MAVNTLKCNHLTPLGLKGLMGVSIGLDEVETIVVDLVRWRKLLPSVSQGTRQTKC